MKSLQGPVPLLSRYGHFRHVQDLQSQFFLKRLSKRRDFTASRGRLHVYYLFEDTTEDFEIVGVNVEQAASMEGEGQAASTVEELSVTSYSEEQSRVELPPGWEARRVSSKTIVVPIAVSGEWKIHM